MIVNNHFETAPWIFLHSSPGRSLSGGAAQVFQNMLCHFLDFRQVGAVKAPRAGVVVTDGDVSASIIF